MVKKHLWDEATSRVSAEGWGLEKPARGEGKGVHVGATAEVRPRGVFRAPRGAGRGLRGEGRCEGAGGAEVMA